MFQLLVEQSVGSPLLTPPSDTNLTADSPPPTVPRRSKEASRRLGFSVYQKWVDPAPKFSKRVRKHSGRNFMDVRLLIQKT